MKFYSIIALVIFITNGYSQDINTPINKAHKKGDFFLSWGYNWSWYSDSDIKFEGENYNFELKSVKAADRQTPFTFENYFRFNSITIPQYKTNSLLLNNDRYDQFNLAGYGLHALFGVGFTFFEHLIIKTELKGGYINMPNIRTTSNESDSASQSFFFGQYNFSIGGSFNFCENKQKKEKQ